MHVSSSHRYAASPDVVFEMMTDPDVLVAKYEELGHRDVVITGPTADGDGLTVGSRRDVPMDVPGFAKRFLSPMNTVEQTDRWEAPDADGSRGGTWEVTARGVPVSVGGTLRIAPDAGGTTLVEVVGEVTSSIPLVGGKLADLVGGDVERTLVAEEAFNDGYLAERE
jgi:hypothetical protein